MDLLEGDVELTEFESIDVQSIKGVAQGANGFPILMMKGLAPVAKADGGGPTHGAFSGTHSHAHDADGAQGGDDSHEHEHSHDGDGDHGHGHGSVKSAAEAVTAALAKAVTDGQIDEGPDVILGQQIMGLLGQAIANEAQEIAAGSYGETWDIELLNRAADLISCWVRHESSPDESGGEMGAVMDSAAVANPLDNDSTSKSADVAEGETAVDTDAQGTGGGLSKADVEEALTKALQPYKERVDTLTAELAKVKATPVPGGPVMSAVRVQRTEGSEDQAAKAAYYRQMAETVTDRPTADGYRKLARDAADKAQAALPAAT